MGKVETAFQTKLKLYFEGLNCYVTKFNASGISKAGVPDLLMCVNGQYFGVEAKKEDGVISKIQQWNILQIRKAGGHAICVRPSDFKALKKAMETSENPLDELESICKYNEIESGD